ncbi:hypothetical protein [Mycoplasma sp. P36-A1]|uniref:hypothetical protein n=1 Tax=Mycoplasma sp. P36-A1 TaxID=3252900 RepID=UPI003C2DD293
MNNKQFLNDLNLVEAFTKCLPQATYQFAVMLASYTLKATQFRDRNNSYIKEAIAAANSYILNNDSLADIDNAIENVYKLENEALDKAELYTIKTLATCLESFSNNEKIMLACEYAIEAISLKYDNDSFKLDNLQRFIKNTANNLILKYIYQ